MACTMKYLNLGLRTGSKGDGQATTAIKPGEGEAQARGRSPVTLKDDGPTCISMAHFLSMGIPRPYDVAFSKR